MHVCMVRCTHSHSHSLTSSSSSSSSSSSFLLLLFLLLLFRLLLVIIAFSAHRLDIALGHLRQHHGDDCWVGPELEAVWRLMLAARPPQLLVFELWYSTMHYSPDHITCPNPNP